MGSLNIEYPNIPSGTAEAQLGHIKSYLYQLTEKLNLADFSAEKIFEDVSKAIDAESVAAEGNEKTEKLKEYANLKALIIKTGDYAVRNSPDLKKSFESSFGASSDYGTLLEELKREVTENAEGITDLFTYTAGINRPDGQGDIGVATSQFIKSGLLYHENGIPQFGVGVGIISTDMSDDEEVINLEKNRLATFTANEIAFWDQGTKVAYISGKFINFPAANIRGGSIHIGEDEETKCFKVDTSGNLQLGKYFSVSNEGIAKFQNRDGDVTLDLSAGKLDFQISDEIRLSQSAEGIAFNKLVTSGGLTVFKYIGGISAYLNADVGLGLYPTARMSVFDVYDPNSSNVLGKFWDNGGTRSQLDVGGVYLRDGYDMRTEYGVFGFHNDSGCLQLMQNEAHTWFNAYIDENSYSVLEMNSSDNSGLGALMGVANGHGQFSILSNGYHKGGIMATSRGAELRLGGGDASWRVAWNDGESHVQADHHHFLGKSDGLVTGTVSTSECSAYIVIGQPTSGGYGTTAIIPAEIATSRQWQIADETNYINFRIYADGTVTQTGGSSGSGSIIDAYSIR